MKSDFCGSIIPEPYVLAIIPLIISLIHDSTIQKWQACDKPPPRRTRLSPPSDTSPALLGFNPLKSNNNSVQLWELCGGPQKTSNCHGVQSPFPNPAPCLNFRYATPYSVGIPDQPDALGTWGNMKQEDPWCILRNVGHLDAL